MDQHTLLAGLSAAFSSTDDLSNDSLPTGYDASPAADMQEVARNSIAHVLDTTLQCIAPSSSSAKPLQAFVGNQYRQKGHMQYLNQCKKRKHAELEASEAIAKQQTTTNFWNGQRLRYGDMLGDTSDIKAHPNQFTPGGIVSLAFKQVGENLIQQDGIDGSSRGLAAASVTTAASFSCQTRVVHEKLEYLRANRLPFIQTHHPDCTSAEAT